ncbi:MAG: glycerol-3-phosphate dehydrogenase [Gammaproteobacteria bacterium]
MVIGGGINGTGVARDAAGRGLKVLLCEKDDLAQHTSSSSTKLIHGGLRYLEYYEFKLVRSSLTEREVLLRNAPHIIWPLRFVLPHHTALRPRWLLRTGLFLYDHIGGRKRLPASKSIDLRQHPAGAPLKATFQHGFEYSDCWVQDARLVVLNARDAADRGATVLTRTRCSKLIRAGDVWKAELENRFTGESYDVTADAVVNAAGPWVEEVLNLSRAADSRKKLRLVKGSHIVVPKLFDHPYPYIFQHTDGRVLFAIPFEKEFTLLGTTEVEFTNNPQQVTVSEEETAYICDAISQYFRQPVKPGDVVWSYSGVRPLFDDASKNVSSVTRDYELQMDDNGPPLLSVFGGKITTYRKLAEEVIEALARRIDIRNPPWTDRQPLPGGEIPNADFDRFMAECRQRYPWLDQELLLDYARNYGTGIGRIVDGCATMEALGEHFGGGLYEREVVFLMEREWAQRAEDIVWRRTKKGLRMSTAEIQHLEQWLTQYRSTLAA